jgi:nickel/cobalt transporter (NicO) family protein
MKMRKEFVIFAALVVFAAAFSVGAHPLGNFSVNQFSRLEIEKTNIRVLQVLDLAEIPTFQENAKIDRDKNGALSADELAVYAENLTPEFVGNLLLTVDGQTVALRPLSKNISTLPGAGNLSTLRIEWTLVGDLPVDSKAARRVRFENKNNADRLGWNEIVVARAAGITIFDSTAFGSNLSDELKIYPDNLLNAPLQERAAEFSFVSGAVAPVEARLLQNRDGNQTAAPVEKDRLAALLALPEITPTVALFALLLAFGLGALHAMSPGHGKTVVGAYLVGSRGTIKHAAFLGLTVTVTHTLGVFALGLITLFASNYILPERILPFLNFVSGLLVFFIGVSLFKDRLFAALGWQTAAHQHAHTHSHEGGEDALGEHAHSHDGVHFHTHDHSDKHDAHFHTHDGVHYHSHLPPEQITWRSLLALGISGGLLPCPSALVLMLSAISLGRTGFGLILTVAFSLGLAATLTAVGLIFLYAGKVFEHPSLADNRLVKTLPVVSAFVIACVGAIICYNSLA